MRVGPSRCARALLMTFVVTACTTTSHSTVGEAPSVNPSPAAVAPSSNAIEALAARPLHLPAARTGCPADSVRPVNIHWNGGTGGINGYAIGRGPVVLLLSTPSAPVGRITVNGKRLLHRAVVPLSSSSVPGWGALKSVWLSSPGYTGAYLVRGRGLDGSGPVAIGANPSGPPFDVLPGVDPNGGDGYRPAIGYIWLKKPGCYGFQIDGTNFSRVLVAEVIPRSSQH
jgi:hypothetical protein